MLAPHLFRKNNTCETLIDHILCLIEHVQLLRSCEVCDDDALNVSRHRPVIAQLHIPILVSDTPIVEQFVKINWKKADEPSIHRYRDNLARCDVFQRLCESSFESQSSLDVAYIELTGVLKNSASKSFAHKRYKRYLKPYWSEELTTLHRSMSVARSNWVTGGKPRDSNHVVYCSYKAAKRHFRRKHRQTIERYMKINLKRLISSQKSIVVYFGIISIVVGRSQLVLQYLISHSVVTMSIVKGR